MTTCEFLVTVLLGKENKYSASTEYKKTNLSQQANI